MSVKAWVGVIIASIVNVVAYSGIFPVYTIIRAKFFSEDLLGHGVIAPGLIGILDSTLNWAPLIMLIGAFIWAIVSSIAERPYATGGRY